MSDKLIWFNGQLVSPEKATVSVFDHSLLYGNGLFEGIRIYHGKILKLKTHLQRLYDGADIIELPIPYSLDELFDATKKTVEANKLINGYIRLLLTRGKGDLGLNQFVCTNPSTIIIADTIALYPKEVYEKGLAIITAKTMRNPTSAMDHRVKSLNYLNNIYAKVEATKAGVHEAIMLNHEGNVAECTGDNLFIVSKGTLITPPLSAGILPGITRNIVIDLAQKSDIEVKEENFKLEAVYNADECFLTGTAAEIVSVVKVDSKNIGTGQPGPTTKNLTTQYHQLVANAPED